MAAEACWNMPVNVYISICQLLPRRAYSQLQIYWHCSLFKSDFLKINMICMKESLKEQETTIYSINMQCNYTY